MSKNNEVLCNNALINAITPSGLEFGKQTYYIGEYVSKTLVISKYPSSVGAGWISKIANMTGVTLKIHVTPTDASELIDAINKSMGSISARLNEGGLNKVSEKRLERKYRDSEIILKKIDENQEMVGNFCATIRISGRDKEELERREKRVRSALSSVGMRVVVPMFVSEDALLSVSPYGISPKTITDVGNRNMPMSTIAGAFPFNSSGVNDRKGCLLGKDANGGIILLDIWERSGDRTNSNFTVLGVAGVGKSATVKKLLLSEWANGTKVIIIDPEREYQDLCRNIGGQWVNAGGNKGGRINPLQVKKDVTIDSEDTDGEDTYYKDMGKGVGALALHFQFLRTFFKMYLKDIDKKEEALLEEVIEEVYFEKGINYNTDVTSLSNEEFPIMEDIYNKLDWHKNQSGISENMRERYENLALLLRKTSVGADSFLWNGHTSIQLNDDFIVLDTYDLQESDESLKRTQYFNLFSYAWSEASKNRDERVILLIDEAYLIVDPDVPQALQFVRDTEKRGRKYNVSLGIISHSVVDFLDEKVKRYGQALLDIPTYKFWMGTDGKNLLELKDLANLTKKEAETIEKKQRGQGILCVGSKRVHAMVKLEDFELEMFGSGGGN